MFNMDVGWIVGGLGCLFLCEYGDLLGGFLRRLVEYGVVGCVDWECC